MPDLEQLIKLCKKQDRKAQKALYEHFAPTMFGVCRRYIKNDQDAEETMINGFFKVLTKLDSFKNKGSFEGWIRRIMVNESLMYLRKYNMNLSVEINDNNVGNTEMTPDRSLRENEILQLLDFLPIGYRTVFNLYVIEGFSHKEIAEKLKISVNTSKSQLIKARKKLKILLEQNDYRVA